jgi:Arc/MetJ-type ribon-helix-helix transcriptional regulator
MSRDTIQVRAGEELRRQLADLAARWGGIRPLSISEVIREAVARAHADRGHKAEGPKR